MFYHLTNKHATISNVQSFIAICRAHYVENVESEVLCCSGIVETVTGEVSVKLFADDIKIYMEIKDSSETAIFQKAIDNVDEWARKWQNSLLVNVNTC